MSNLSEIIYNYLIDDSGVFNFHEVLARVIIIAVMIVVWILLGIILNKIIKIVINKSLQVNKNGARARTVANLLSSIFKYLVWFIVGLLILGELNVDVTPFLASAGVIGLAIGFGAQQIVRDFISGFFIIFEGSFNVGDIVEIDGFKGEVKSLGLRTTIIENWLGEVKIVTNGNIDSIINYSKNNSIAIIDFGVGYDTDLNKLNNLMDSFVKQVDEKFSEIVEPTQFLGVTELADSSINMRIIAKTGVMKHFHVEREVRKDLVIFLTTHNIEIPFPQVVVHNA